MKNTSINFRGLSLLTLAHALNDLNQGAIPALIPFLVTLLKLNFFSAAGITLASTLISSFLQPLLGLTSDRKSLSWLIPVGMLLGGAGLALSGWMRRYDCLLAAILISGVGTAAFHPEAYRYANYYSRGQTATGMSIFSGGGNVGFAIGPLALTFCVLHWGLSSIWVIILPAAFLAVYFIAQQPYLQRLRQEKQAEAHQQGQSNWRAFSLLISIIVVRSMAYYCLSTFVPLFLIQIKGFSAAVGNSALTVMSVSSIVGALVGGALADRWGHRPTLFTLALTIAISILCFVAAPGIFPFVFLAIANGGLSASFTISMVMGQYYGQSNIGLASGLTTGFAIGIGGVSAPLFGILADHIGLSATLAMTAALPAIASIAILFLPRDFSPEEVS